MTLKYALTIHPEFGECLLAAQDICAGEIVIQELPALVINYELSDVVLDFNHIAKRAYVTLSECAKVSLTIASTKELTRRRLLETLYVPEVKNAQTKTSIAYKAAKQGVRELRARATAFPLLQNFTDHQLLKFSLLASANAHSITDTSIALLYAGAKVSHTCMYPNVAVSSRPLRDIVDDTTIKHIALRDIKAGELLLGTYAKVNTQPRLLRQNHLQEHKMFLCACASCKSPDLMRRIRYECECGFIYQTDNNQWVCTGGHVDLVDTDKVIAEYKHQELTIQQLLDEQPTEEDISEAEKWTSIHCGPGHYLVLQVLHSQLEMHSSLLENAAHEDSTDFDDGLDVAAHSIEVLEHCHSRIASWLKIHKFDISDEMAPAYLLTVDRILDFAASRIQHEARACILVQTLLDAVRPIIEQRRSWPIGHAMEEYFDELEHRWRDITTSLSPQSST